jgi:hypothetical protein
VRTNHTDGSLLGCNLVEVYQRFRGAYCLHRQGESYETHKYKMQSYWLLKQLVHIVTIRL